MANEYQIGLENLENKVYDLVSELTSLPIKWLDDNTNKLNGSQYLLIKTRNLVEKGIGANAGYDELDNKITSKEWEVIIDIDCRRGRYTQAPLAQIVHAFQKHSELYEKYFSDDTASFLRIERGITPRNAIIDKESWEERSRVTLAFNIVVKDTDLYSDGSIESVQINPMRVKVESSTVVEDTFTIEYP